MNRRTFHLVHEQARANAMECVKTAPGGFVVTVAEPRRTNSQNRRYWGGGVLAQIAEQARVAGRRFDATAWHELFKRQFIGLLELPDGSVVGMSSAHLGKKAFSEFCDRVEAHAATELGVTFHDLQPHD